MRLGKTTFGRIASLRWATCRMPSTSRGSAAARSRIPRGPSRNAHTSSSSRDRSTTGAPTPIDALSSRLRQTWRFPRVLSSPPRNRTTSGFVRVSRATTSTGACCPRTSPGSSLRQFARTLSSLCASEATRSAQTGGSTPWLRAPFLSPSSTISANSTSSRFATSSPGSTSSSSSTAPSSDLTPRTPSPGLCIVATTATRRSSSGWLTPSRSTEPTSTGPLRAPGWPSTCSATL
mmetsp:Transcript_13454/g.42497  ORF Transcript_13454/g.42497 Transcript_13454/m.42497 type:complete len:234 (+) Transcript_13454:498-1199(+)